MQLTEIIPSGQRRVFSLEEAKELLPLIKRITAQSEHELRRVLTFMKHGQLPTEKKKELQRKTDRIIARWSAKISRMGVVVKGLWLVDFDMGRGYYCWKYGEEEIRYYHTYEDGFAGRVPLEQVH